MIKIEKDRFEFAPGSEEKGLVRRLTVREAASVQTFPDSFKFEYTQIVNGYKMVGNAVPVKFAEHIAASVYAYLAPLTESDIPATGKIQSGRPAQKL
jgi:DNA (cytosine-5)-methyltransferase 1